MTTTKSVAELEAQLAEAKGQEAQSLSVEASAFVNQLISQFGRESVAKSGKSAGKTFVNMDSNKLSLAQVEGYDIRSSRFGLVIEKL